MEEQQVSVLDNQRTGLAARLESSYPFLYSTISSFCSWPFFQNGTIQTQNKNVREIEIDKGGRGEKLEDCLQTVFLLHNLTNG